MNYNINYINLTKNINNNKMKKQNNKMNKINEYH